MQITPIFIINSLEVFLCMQMTPVIIYYFLSVWEVIIVVISLTKGKDSFSRVCYSRYKMWLKDSVMAPRSTPRSGTP